MPDYFQDAIRSLPAGSVVTLGALRSLLPPNVGARDEHGQNGWHRETLLRSGGATSGEGVTYR